MGWLRLRCDLEEGTGQAGGETEEAEAVQGGQGVERWVKRAMVAGMGRMLQADAREITYAGPGLLVGSRLLSRLGLLSSSAFLQGLLSFTLICLERKF